MTNSDFYTALAATPRTWRMDGERIVNEAGFSPVQAVLCPIRLPPEHKDNPVAWDGTPAGWTRRDFMALMRAELRAEPRWHEDRQRHLSARADLLRACGLDTGTGTA